MSGDPCICGDKETWHPECYQKAEVAKRQAEAEASFAAGRSEGIAEGMRMAAEITDTQCGECSASIRIAANPLQATVPRIAAVMRLLAGHAKCGATKGVDASEILCNKRVYETKG